MELDTLSIFRSLVLYVLVLCFILLDDYFEIEAKFTVSIVCMQDDFIFRVVSFYIIPPYLQGI